MILNRTYSTELRAHKPLELSEIGFNVVHRTGIKRQATDVLAWLNRTSKKEILVKNSELLDTVGDVDSPQTTVYDFSYNESLPRVVPNTSTSGD